MLGGLLCVPLCVYVGTYVVTDGVWVNSDGLGLTWTQQCFAPGVCPWVYPGLFVQQATLVGLYDLQTWVFAGHSTFNLHASANSWNEQLPPQ